MTLKSILLGSSLWFTLSLVAQDTLLQVGFIVGSGHCTDNTKPMLSNKTSRTIYNEFGQRRYEVYYTNKIDSTIRKEWRYDEQHRIIMHLYFWSKQRIDTTTFDYFDDFVRLKATYDMVKVEMVWTLNGKIVSSKSERYKTSDHKELQLAYSSEVSFDSLENCECQSMKTYFISPDYPTKFEGTPNFEHCSWFNSDGLVIRKRNQNLFSDPQNKYFKYDAKGRKIEEISVNKQDTIIWRASYTTKGDSLYEKTYWEHSGEYVLNVYLKNKVDRGPCYYAVFELNGERKIKIEYIYDQEGYVIQSRIWRKPEMIYDEFSRRRVDRQTDNLEVKNYVYERFSKATFIPQKAYEPD